MSDDRKLDRPKTRFEQIAEEPGIGMDNDGNLNVVGFDPALAAPQDGVGRPIRRLHVPLKKPEDVMPHLGSPGHYREGRSAYCLANAWMTENNLPELVRLTLDTAPTLGDATLLEGFFEREVSLQDGARHSQTDLLCLLNINQELESGYFYGQEAVVRADSRSRAPFSLRQTDKHD